jgi:hypothetical protein
MNFVKHVSFALIMVCLFSMSYLPEKASAQAAGRGCGEECEEAQERRSTLARFKMVLNTHRPG